MQSPRESTFSPPREIFTRRPSIYTGSNVTLQMYDVDAGGSCPGAIASPIHGQVIIPSMVEGTTAYIWRSRKAAMRTLPVRLGSTPGRTTSLCCSSYADVLSTCRNIRQHSVGDDLRFDWQQLYLLQHHRCTGNERHWGLPQWDALYRGNQRTQGTNFYAVAGVISDYG